MTTAARAFSRVDDVVDEVRDILAAADVVGVLAHKDADADSLGSALAFALSLRAGGKTVHVLVPEPMPRLLTHLPGYATIAPVPDRLDALFTFDCATVQRFGEKSVLVETVTPVVNVDHHASNEAFGTVNLVEVDAAATAQVVYRLLLALDLPIDADVATNLYAGLLTDTGGFRHENTTADVLRLAADLVAHGVDAGWVALKSYKSRSVAQTKLEGLAVSVLETDIDGRLVWSRVTLSMLECAGSDMQDSEGIIDPLQAIDTMEVAVLFKEVTATVTKISVRTRGPFDATDICRPFGGGGHRRSAGAEMEMGLDAAMAAVLDVARALVRADA